MSSTIARWVGPLLLVAACGGGDKKPVKKPIAKSDPVKPEQVESEQDREAKRKAAALAIVPDGSTCFPLSLRDVSAPKLELVSSSK